MSTPGDSYFLVVAPDVPNAEREKHTPQHIEYSMPLLGSGYIVFGGGLLPNGKVTADADARESLIGSFIIVKANSSEEVWEKLKADVYYTSGQVWDHEKLQVTPVFVPAAPPKWQ